MKKNGGSRPFLSWHIEIPRTHYFYNGSAKKRFSDLLETMDSDRGPWDLDLSAKMEALDPSRAEIWTFPRSIYEPLFKWTFILVNNLFFPT